MSPENFPGIRGERTDIYPDQASPDILGNVITLGDRDLFHELTGNVLDEETTIELNSLIEGDNPDLRNTNGLYQANSTVIADRAQFFAILGLPTEQVKRQHPSLHPLERTFRTLQEYHSLGLETAKVINTFPGALDYAPKAVRAKVANLTNLRLNAIKIINAFPVTVGLAPKSVRAKVANLTNLGLDAAKVINTSPVALSYAQESVREKVANLTNLGLDAARVINTQPTVLGYAQKAVREKVANLTNLGLDATKIINTSSTVLGYAQESVREKVANLTNLGLDAARVINTFPVAVGLAPKSVREKVANLTDLDLDAAKVINTFPGALGLAQEKIRLTVYACMKLGIWEDSGKDGFIGYQSLLNNGRCVDIFTLPIESLLLYAAENHSDQENQNLINSVKKYVENNNINKGNRKEKSQDLIHDPDARKKLGYLAVLYTLKEGIDWPE